MIERARKKPVVIEFVTWRGTEESWRELLELDGGKSEKFCVGRRLFIQTVEGRMEAQVGDKIIRGVKGELYPCKPDIFDATYELVG